jgi:nucleotide-binding universal stress UspA family protein
MKAKAIIGYERTAQGEDALALGHLLCEALRATPVLATALPYSKSAMDRESLERALEADTEEMFATPMERLHFLDPESRAIASRSPGDALAQLAEAEEVRLIVIGSTHRGVAGQVLLGTTGESLMHGAPAAVAIAPRDFARRESPDLLRIAVAYDGTDESRQALGVATALARRVHGSLTVICAAEPPRPGYGTTAGILLSSDYTGGERDRMARVLDSALAEVPSGLPVEGKVLVGPAAEVIRQAGADQDLLVMGSRGNGPLRRTLLGSVSASLARSSKCPLLVIPRGAGPDPLGLAERAMRQGQTSR